MSGKRTFKKVTIDRSEGDTVTKSIVCPEGGWVGYMSVWHRRVQGTANAVLRVYASFNADATEDEKMELTWGNVYDNLDTFLWGWYAEFPYLYFEVDFTDYEGIEDENQPATVELYLVTY